MTALHHRVAQGTSVLAATVTLVAAMAATARAAEPPPNDAMADATPITVGWTGSADLTAATVDEGEPLSACQNLGHTVWYALTVPHDMVVDVDTSGSQTDTVLVAWADEYLTDPYACANDADGSLQARASFVARAGQTYLLQVGVDGEKGAQPGPISLAVREAPKPTGKPQVGGGRDASVAANAFWDGPRDGEQYHIAQVDVSDVTEHSFGSTPERRLQVKLDSRRLRIDEAGLRYSDEWFGLADLGRDDLRLDDALRGGTVDVTLEVERYRCVTTSPEDVDGVCGPLPSETVRLQVTWTGTGEVQRDLLRLSDRGFGYHTSGTRQVAWRDAAVTATLTGDTELDISARPAAAVLVRDAVRTSWWERD